MSLGVWFTLCLMSSLVVAGPMVRKDQAHLTREEIDRFVEAVNALKHSGVYDELVRMHVLTYPLNRDGTPSESQSCLHNEDRDNTPLWYV